MAESPSTSHPRRALASAGRILVADDEPSIRELIAETLQAEGYVCDCVPSAEAAACALATVAYDLLITDIHMPGNESLDLLRGLEPGANTPPIILMTGRPTVGTVLEARRLSVVNYLIKPLDVQELRELVALAIAKGKVLRALRKARTEIAVWQEGLAALENTLLSADPKDSRSGKPVHQAVDQMALLLGQVLGSLNATIGLLVPRPMANDLCALVHCRQSTVYQDALRDAVGVLLATKGAFRSKELAELRKRLDAVLKPTEGSIPH